VLSFIGAAFGLLVAMWATDWILAASPIQLPSFVNIGLDASVVLFSIALASVTGLIMGLTPAVTASPSNLHDTMKIASAKASAGLSRNRFRNALVVGEVAMTFVLLVGAGLLIESFRRLSQVDPGFQPAGLLSMRVNLVREGAANTVRETLGSLPGVQSVVLASDIPFSGSSAIFYTAEGQENVDATNVPRGYIHNVTPGYFRTLRIPLIHGRDFETTEPDANIVIVSESVVKRFWPEQDPIGKRIKRGGTASTNPWLQIVGVAGETKTRGLPNNPTADPDLYFPFPNQARGMGVLIRASNDPSTLILNATNEVRRLDKLAIVSAVSTLDDLMRPLTARSRFTSWLTGIFSGMALVLALIGIYGTMSYIVAERTREIGIRVAVGASRLQIFGMVLSRGLALMGAGLVLGLMGSIFASRGISGLLFGVTPTEPSIFITVSALMIVTGILAAYFPARRAIRIDTIRALREE